ncbi:iron ABC transporter permease [Hahella sp. SMD15-11]|uniref:Iron ABC transporter permease n=1 Tax=Thermohahella caldifontis TaxID=3142973 RepID=A0AB39UT84_9GAMM
MWQTRNDLIRYGWLSGGLCLWMLIQVQWGALELSPLQALGDLLRQWYSAGGLRPGSEGWLLWEIRLPRIVLGALAGSALALAGAALQGLFRNPLADPGLMGVSAGAVLGAVSAIVLTGHNWGIMPAAFVGSLFATVLAIVLARRHPTDRTAPLLLAGIAVNAVCGTLTGLLTWLADDNQLRSLTFWSMGSLAYGRWPELALLAATVIVMFAALLRLAPALDAWSLSPSVAHHLGFEPKALRRKVIVWVTLGVALSTALTGTLAFVGLVAPHLVRLTGSVSHRRVLPLSALLGAFLTLTADALARTLIAPAELPVGLVLSALGAPFFVYLLYRRPGEY